MHRAQAVGRDEPGPKAETKVNAPCLDFHSLLHLQPLPSGMGTESPLYASSAGSDSLTAFRALLLAAQSPQELAQQILDRFDVYQSVGCDDRGSVLFTGYYTPIFEGSLEPSAAYRWPLYRLPPDLVKDGEGLCIGRRLSDGRVVPYPTRRELETSGELAGLELVYLKDKFDAYICHVQGSARFRLPDGSEFEVGYAGKNAGEYQSVGRLLLAD